MSKRRLSTKDLQAALHRLETGREFLKANKWIRGAQKLDESSTNSPAPVYGYCAYGALRYCDTRQGGLSAAAKILAATINTRNEGLPSAEVLDVASETHYSDIFDYNDETARGKRQVVGMFDAAINHVKQALSTEAQLQEEAQNAETA